LGSGFLVRNTSGWTREVSTKVTHFIKNPDQESFGTFSPWCMAAAVMLSLNLFIVCGGFNNHSINYNLDIVRFVSVQFRTGGNINNMCNTRTFKKPCFLQFVGIHAIMCPFSSPDYRARDIDALVALKSCIIKSFICSSRYDTIFSRRIVTVASAPRA
jgi:hypothetical protein